MDNDEFKRIVGDAMILNYLINLYTAIAGISHGYVSSIMNERDISRKEAEKYVLKIDEAARDKVAEAYKELENDRGEAT